MMEFAMYVFMTVVTDGVMTETNSVYPRSFVSEEACHAMVTPEMMTNTRRYLAESMEGKIIAMQFQCVGDLSSVAENFR